MRRIVVVSGGEALELRLDADSSRDREGPQVIGRHSRRRHEIGQRPVTLAGGQVLLLAQEVQAREFTRTRGIGVNRHIIVLHGVGREQADDTARPQPTLTDRAAQHAPCVGVEACRLLAVLRIGQDVGKAAAQFPGLKERRPVDVAGQFLERIVIEDAHPELPRDRRRVALPVAA